MRERVRRALPSIERWRALGQWVRRLVAAALAPFDARAVQFFGGLALAWYGGAPTWSIGAVLAGHAIVAPLLVRREGVR